MRYDVDYTEHPAFKKYLVNNSTNGDLREVFASADDAIQGHLRSRYADDAGLCAQLAGKVDQVLRSDGGVEPDFRPYVISAFENSVTRSLDEERQKSVWGKRSRGASRDVVANTERIHHEGYVMFKMPAGALSRLKEVLKGDIEIARKKGRDNPDDIAIAPPSAPEARDIVHEFCEQSGIYDTLSRYYGQRFGSVGFVVHVSQPADTWFHIFDDIGLNMPATAQMHFDLDFAAPKSMLYLNDVGEKNGAFSLRQKANPWEWFGSQLAFRKEINGIVHKYVTEKHGKTTYGNTSIFRYEEARRAYASLPAPLRGTSHQADHIRDGSALSAELLQSERKLCGEAGTMPVFTGSHVLHRGGLVSEGERIALQIVYYKVPEAPAPGNVQILRSKLGGVARKLGLKK